LKYKQRTLLITLAALAVIVNIAGVLAGIRAVRVLDYVPCFLAGVLAFCMLNKCRRSIAPGRWLFTLGVGVTLLVFGSIGWPTHRVLYEEWAISSCIALLLPLHQEASPSFLTTAAKWVAKYSYGIYLCHMPAVWFAFEKCKTDGTTAILLTLTTTTVASIFAYHAIEAPLIAIGRRLADRVNTTTAVAV
jgi:peptidoglycan/LPS O-acetylase OafA/YrhL